MQRAGDKNPHGRSDQRRVHCSAAMSVACLGLLTGCNVPLNRPSPDTPTAAQVSSLPIITPPATTPAPQATTLLPTEITPTAILGQPTASPACTNRAGFVEDVTIRDNTEVAANGAFSKVWRLRNEGSCAWTQSYQLVFVGGNQLGGQSAVPLRMAVAPGESLELEIDLTAPELPGTYQGYWKLRAPGGEYFGVGANGDLAFWVKIVVPPPSTTTAVPTPNVQASGSVTLSPGSTLDLDQGLLNAVSGADLVFDTARQPRSLRPLAGASMVIFTSREPPSSPAECQAVPLTSDPIPFIGPAFGTMICYRTSESRIGFLTIGALDGTLSLTFTTWAP